MLLLSQENKEQLKKRWLSFAWRTGMMVLALVAAELSNNLELFNLPGGAIVLLGLILGEVSKYLNNRVTEGENP